MITNHYKQKIMAYTQNNPFSRKTSSPFYKRGLKSSPLNQNHNVEPRTGEWTIDPNDPNVRSRDIVTSPSEEYTGETLESGSEKEKAWAKQKAYCDTMPPGTPGCGGFHKYEGGVETEYQDRDVIDKKKLENYRQIYRKNMTGDRQYGWEDLYANWNNTAKLYEPRSGEDYFLDKAKTQPGNIDFDFGIDHRTAEQGGNIEGKHVKNQYYEWEKIPAGRLPYVNLKDSDNQSRWSQNIRRSYNSNLNNYADEYINNLNTNSDVPITSQDLTQDQHNEIYYGAKNKWFKNFKAAYPEITWGPRDTDKGIGSTSQFITPWRDRN